jgi:hypothetical protein
MNLIKFTEKNCENRRREDKDKGINASCYLRREEGSAEKATEKVREISPGKSRGANRNLKLINPCAQYDKIFRSNFVSKVIKSRSRCLHCSQVPKSADEGVQLGLGQCT